MEDLKILAVIPARGGSKGVSRKNIREINGKPLLAYSIQAAMDAGDVLYKTIISTDDLEIATIAKALGGEVPFLRPAELARDQTPMVPVIKHAVSQMEKLDLVTIDCVLLLQPTAIFRTGEDIRESVSLMKKGGCDSVISVVQVFSTHPILMKKIVEGWLVPFCIEEKEGTRRQDYQPPAYMRNGAIYLSRRGNIMEHDSLWGKTIRPYVMPEERSINIDSEFDLKMAEYILISRKQS
jgi:CMP-N,N'-diacetyllegionaminic acid synthase